MIKLLLLLLAGPLYECSREEARARHLPPLAMRFECPRPMRKFPQYDTYFGIAPTPPGGVWVFRITAYRDGKLPKYPGAVEGSLMVDRKKRQAFAFFDGAGPARAERCAIVIPYDARSGAILYCAVSSSKQKADPQHFVDWQPLKSFTTNGT